MLNISEDLKLVPEYNTLRSFDNFDFDFTDLLHHKTVITIYDFYSISNSSDFINEFFQGSIFSQEFFLEKCFQVLYKINYSRLLNKKPDCQKAIGNKKKSMKFLKNNNITAIKVVKSNKDKKYKRKINVMNVMKIKGKKVYSGKKGKKEIKEIKNNKKNLNNKIDFEVENIRINNINDDLIFDIDDLFHKNICQKYVDSGVDNLPDFLKDLSVSTINNSGNSLFSAMLKSCDFSQSKAYKLRQMICDVIEKKDFFDEKKSLKNKEDYLKDMRLNEFSGSEIEVEALSIKLNIQIIIIFNGYNSKGHFILNDKVVFPIMILEYIFLNGVDHYNSINYIHADILNYRLKKHIFDDTKKLISIPEFKYFDRIYTSISKNLKDFMRFTIDDKVIIVDYEYFKINSKENFLESSRLNRFKVRTTNSMHSYIAKYWVKCAIHNYWKEKNEAKDRIIKEIVQNLNEDVKIMEFNRRYDIENLELFNIDSRDIWDILPKV
jgi:hypothetical protein